MKKVIGIILIIVISLIVFTGCTSDAEYIDRFKKIHDEGAFEVIYDKETKVQYLTIDYAYGSAITVLVDAEGKPLLYEGE